MAPVLEETPRDTPDFTQSRESPSATLKLSTDSQQNGNVTKRGSRLQSELMSLMLSNTPGISAFPSSDTDLTCWTATITGPSATPYENLTFRLSFEFPPSYPYQPPKVLFKTPIYHPNIDFSGRICLDILKDKWSAMLGVQSVLLSLQSLLGEPNNASPLNAQAAELWDQDQEEFKRHVLARHQEPSDDDENDS